MGIFSSQMVIAPLAALIPDKTKSPGRIRIIFVPVFPTSRNSILPVSNLILLIIGITPNSISLGLGISVRYSKTSPRGTWGQSTDDLRIATALSNFCFDACYNFKNLLFVFGDVIN